MVQVLIEDMKFEIIGYGQVQLNCVTGWMISYMVDLGVDDARDLMGFSFIEEVDIE